MTNKTKNLFSRTISACMIYRPRRFGFLASLGLWLVAFAAPVVAPASTIFSNFGPGFSYNAAAGLPVGNAFDGNDYAEGATFTPLATTSFGSLLIALSCPARCPAVDPFTVFLTGDRTNQPGSVLESFTVSGASLGALGTHNAPLVLNSLLRPSLLAGTQYWITVAADLRDSITWNLNTTGDTADQAISTDGGSTWFSPSGNTPGAFEVDTPAGAVPEPHTAGLLAGGLLLGLMRKRNRQQIPR